jgi:hypothetical protein
MEPRRKPGTFIKGDPRAGRPQGSRNKTTPEIRQLARNLLTDARYLTTLRKRLREGTAGRIEELLYQYAWGTPPAKLLDSTTEEPEGEMIVVKVREASNGHHGV